MNESNLLRRSGIRREHIHLETSAIDRQRFGENRAKSAWKRPIDESVKLTLVSHAIIAPAAKTQNAKRANKRNEMLCLS